MIFKDTEEIPACIYIRSGKGNRIATVLDLEVADLTKIGFNRPEGALSHHIIPW